MIIIGIILIVLALLFPVKLGILFTIGVIVLVVGLLLLLLGSIGHPVGGRRYWW